MSRYKESQEWAWQAEVAERAGDDAKAAEAYGKAAEIQDQWAAAIDHNTRPVTKATFMRSAGWLYVKAGRTADARRLGQALLEAGWAPRSEREHGRRIVETLLDK